MKDFEKLFGIAMWDVTMALDHMRAAETTEGVPEEALHSLNKAEEFLRQFLDAVKAESAEGE